MTSDSVVIVVLVETAKDLYKNGIEYYDGEEVIAIYLYNYIKFIVQYIVNNQTPPTLYGPGISTTGISSQTQYFDLTITQDPENTNLTTSIHLRMQEI